MNKKQNRQRGFSLIELMIVIAIIGLLIGVGVPAWQYMVRNGNEVATLTTMRQISERQAQFASNHKGDFGTFEELTKATGFNENFKGEKPVVNGYIYELKIDKRGSGKPSFFSVKATPEAASSGTRSFYVDSNLSNIRGVEGGEAGPESPSV